MSKAVFLGISTLRKSNQIPNIHLTSHFEIYFCPMLCLEERGHIYLTRQIEIYI